MKAMLDICISNSISWLISTARLYKEEFEKKKEEEADKAIADKDKDRDPSDKEASEKEFHETMANIQKKMTSLFNIAEDILTRYDKFYDTKLLLTTHYRRLPPGTEDPAYIDNCSDRFCLVWK